MQEHVTVVLIDDDPLNNLLSKTIINQHIKNVNLFIFEEAKDGLDFVTSNIPLSKSETVIILLDINMPNLSGWQFLESLEAHNHGLIKQFYIFMLSSSILLSDKQKANSNQNVLQYFEKPLNSEKVNRMLAIISEIQLEESELRQ